MEPEKRRDVGLQRRSVMADDLKLKGPQDRSRINMHEDYEVRYWTEKFGVSKQQLQDAVNSVGNASKAVAQHLGKESKET
jgi:hypothetical protein